MASMSKHVVGRGFQPDHPGVVGPVGTERVEVGEVDCGPRVAHWTPDLGDQAEGSAVGVVAEQDALAAAFGGDGEEPQNVVFGSETAGEGEAVSGLFKRGDLCLERGTCRVARPRVLEALVVADAVLGKRG